MGKLLDDRTKAQLRQQEGEDLSICAQQDSHGESNDAVWNELAEALINVREEMAEVGISHEEAKGRASAILKGLGFR